MLSNPEKLIQGKLVFMYIFDITHDPNGRKEKLRWVQSIPVS
jgi:hypothetical protein